MTHINFCGEVFPLDPDEPFVIGRECELELDDNPYLHRRFLTVSHVQDLWWLHNVGSRISATVSDADGRMQAWLAPGAGLPLVFARTTVIFTAGPTTYEVDVVLDDPQFAPVAAPQPVDGGLTIGEVSFTPAQLLLIVALAEPALRREGWGTAALPSSVDAASRLGWTLRAFNRKLDNVCEKVSKMGVKGLHGGTGKLANERRVRLVEYAIAARWVTADDVLLLDRPSSEAD